MSTPFFLFRAAYIISDNKTNSLTPKGMQRRKGCERRKNEIPAGRFGIHSPQSFEYENRHPKEETGFDIRRIAAFAALLSSQVA